MLTILPELIEDQPANSNKAFEDLFEQYILEVKKLGVDREKIKNNFVIFDASQYNKEETEKLLNQAISYLENAKLLMESLEYNSCSAEIENLIKKLQTQ